MHLKRNEFENNLKIGLVVPHRSIEEILSTVAIDYLTDTKKINNPPMILPERCAVRKIVSL